LVVLLSLLACALAAPAAQAVSVNITGPREMVFDYETERCTDFDWPDIPARAFRDAVGRTQLVLGQGSRPNSRMIGPDLDNLVRDCTPILSNSNNPMPSDYDDAEWMSGIYSPDGQEVFALIHSEYHGIAHAGYCGDVFLDCRYNTITYAHSSDMANSFQQPAPPGQLVAAIPYRFVPGEGRYGFFTPSNIFQKDGYFYNMILASADYREQESGVCLMRTQDLADPKSWRAWDGEGFNVRFIDPYRDSAQSVSRHVCDPIAPDALGQINRSVVWSTFLNKWVVVGTETGYEPAFGEVIRGFYFSTSDDLIHWSQRQLLMRVETAQTWQCGDPDPAAYPSFIDPSSTDRNFNTMDQTAYVYMTTFRRENCLVTSKRDVMRMPIQFMP
jgi:hypothetical protein